MRSDEKESKRYYKQQTGFSAAPEQHGECLRPPAVLKSLRVRDVLGADF